jgi:uncharacterized protein (TIGR03067 family)
MRVTGAFLLGLSAFVLAMCPLVSTAQPADEKKADPFQGTWEVVKLEQGGQDLSEGLKDGPATLKFVGNKYTFTAGEDVEEGTFKFDAKAKTPTIDLTITEGRAKGKIQLGIYKLDGDTLKVCLGEEGGKERPTKFSTAADSADFVMFTLQRKKKLTRG